MIPGGISETVWHFIGHFQVVHDVARDRIEYDPSAYRQRSDDYTTPRPEDIASPDIDDLDSRGIPMPALPPLDDQPYERLLPIRLRSPSATDPEFDTDPSRLDPPLRPGGGGGGGGGGGREVTVIYEPGGEQTELQIKQYNLLTDNDVVLQGHGVLPEAIDGNVALLAAHAETVLHEMADGANSVIPTEWWMDKSNEGAVDFVQTFDAAHNGSPVANSVDPGYYLNGELQTPAPEPPSPTLDLYEKPDLGHGTGQWAEAGANSSFNAALIVDLTEAGQTMIVKGDYFSTNAIFQTNSLIDHDKVMLAGGVAPEPSTGNNTTDNTADFINHPGLYSAIPAHFGGWDWHVNVVNGDYYSVHTVAQTNVLMDNDVVVQTESQTHDEVVAGANGQVNLAEIFDGSIHYDLIIVAGSYHGMNVIFQNNILLDNDVMKQFAGNLDSPHAADSGDSSHAASSGDNQLANAATIESFGGQEFLPMSDDMMAIFAAISGGASSLDPTLTKILAGPDGVINVLYVTGDYYDINAIWQTNVTSDVDVMLQLIDPKADKASAHPEDPSTQSASTGANKLINDAVIVDVAATHTYVDGTAYSDTILIQANLLPTDLDHAVRGDTHTLVTELVAFVADHQDETPTTQAVVGLPPPDDPIANVLH